MDSRDPVVVFFEKSVIQSITLLRKWDFIYRIEGRMSSAMYRTPNLTIMIVRMKNANFIIFTFKQL